MIGLSSISFETCMCHIVYLLLLSAGSVMPIDKLGDNKRMFKLNTIPMSRTASSEFTSVE